MGVAAIAAVLGLVIRLTRTRAARDRHSSEGDAATHERELIDHVADAHGFEYAHYRLRDRSGASREAWCRIIPTTIPFSCPDCGGMVEGVDARRIWPGTAGPEPTAFRCARCGRQERRDFGVPLVTEREADPVFEEPRGAHTVCSRGDRHALELLEEWS